MRLQIFTYGAQTFLKKTVNSDQCGTGNKSWQCNSMLADTGTNIVGSGTKTLLMPVDGPNELGKITNWLDMS